MEDDIKQISNNLRIVREHKGDTRKELVTKLKIYPYNTIVAYELGKRTVPDEYIETVAKLYRVSVNMLKEQFLTKELLKYYDSLIDIANLHEKYVFFFYASATSEAARANEHFKKAEEYRKRIENFDCMKTMPNSARYLYYKSFIENGILAGAANTLMMLFLEYVQTTVLPDVSSKLILGELTNGDLYIQLKTLFSDLSLEKKEFIKANQAIFDKCIKGLGNADQGKIYAEYYTALKYILCMIDNGRGYRENIEIGAVMMKEFSNIGNPLAKKAVEFFGFE